MFADDQRLGQRIELSREVSILNMEQAKGRMIPRVVIVATKDISRTGVKLITEQKLDESKVWLRFEDEHVETPFFEAEVVREDVIVHRLEFRHTYAMRFTYPLSEQELMDIVCSHIQPEDVVAETAEHDTSANY